jgi:hypothetical protein
VLAEWASAADFADLVGYGAVESALSCKLVPANAVSGAGFGCCFVTATKILIKPDTSKNVRIFTVLVLTCLWGGDYKPTH